MRIVPIRKPHRRDAILITTHRVLSGDWLLDGLQHDEGIAIGALLVVIVISGVLWWML